MIPRCERCGCRTIKVSSLVHSKTRECIRHLNTPESCLGTELYDFNPYDHRQPEDKET